MRRVSAENPDMPIAITTRQLEALTRLAEAHARMALKSEVTVEDAEAAIRLMKAFLEGAGIDIESGHIDIDIIMTGKPKSKQQKYSRVLEIIEELEAESEEGCAWLKQIVERAVADGIESRIVDEAIKMFYREGVIMEKKPQCWSVVR